MFVPDCRCIRQVLKLPCPEYLRSTGPFPWRFFPMSPYQQPFVIRLETCGLFQYMPGG